MRGFGSGLAGMGRGANGIAGAIQKIGMMPYLIAMQEQRGRSAAAVEALNRAKLEEMNARMAASRLIAEQAGRPDLAGLSPSEMNQALAALRSAELTDLSAKARASLTDGADDIARIEHEDNVRRYTEMFNRALKDVSAITRAVNGSGLYQYQPNGAAFNPSYGTSDIADSEARNLYRQKVQAEIARMNRSNRGGQGGSSTAGWQIRQTDDGGTVRINARTGQIEPLDVKLKSNGRGGRPVFAETPEDKLLENARAARKGGAPYDKVAMRYKELTGKEYSE